MEGSGLVAHTDPVQLGPAVNDMYDKASGSENFGIVGSQSSGGSGSIPQGEALMDAGVVLGQATHEVRISQNSCLVPSHIPIRLSREEILSVSPHSMCMRPNYPNCMIWDGIVYNFGPDSDKDADPSDFFPLNLLSPPNPNNNTESALFENPVSYPTSSSSTSNSDEHGPVLEGNPISLEISSQISINPHQDSHLFYGRGGGPYHAPPGAMITMSWNCRGICNAATVKALRASIRANHPEIIFLSETKASVSRINRVAKLLGFSNFHVVEAIGRSGGICMLWSSSVQVEVLEFDSHMISLAISDGLCEWTLVEKEGGHVGSSSSPNFLKDLLFDLGAVDLDFVGNSFTWSNRRWGRGSIRERLDRGIASVSWRVHFPKATIYHLGAVNSDHCPLLLNTNPSDIHIKRPFCFIAAWTRDPRSTEIVQGAWNISHLTYPGLQLGLNHGATATALGKWNKLEFGFCHYHIQKLTNLISEIQGKPATEENARREAYLQSDLNEWLTRTDLLWKQKSRELWLKNGDRNTKFFHLSTIIKQRHNSIDAIKTEEGDLDNLIPQSITVAENEELNSIPSPAEIKRAIFDMDSLKAPGPDGFPPLFYKHYWNIVGGNVIDTVQDFFKHGRLTQELNSTFIVLIPKVPNPTSTSHYRPISLCNVVYKAISKILVAKLRPLLDKLISPAQSAFIPGRWIAENQVIVKELIHSFKTRKVKEGFVAIKIDLQKAYDRLNWGFLKAVLLQFGFSADFVKWIMLCVTSVSSSLLINGGKTKTFFPTRGLRQGDPLSPYLFILCQEVLSRMFERQHAVGNLHGVRMNVTGPAISHVMFADDIMIFAKANRREVEVVDDCLESYCQWFGQLVNRGKSGLFFSKRVHRNWKRWIRAELQMTRLPLDAFYLGSPLFSSKSKTKDFKFLIERIDSKLKGWRCKSLSWAGRKTLITSVAQAIPTYSFSTAAVPSIICNKLDSTSRRFWWNPKKLNGSYLAWKSWDVLCLPKAASGLGFRQANVFNQALLAKLTWLIASKKKSLCLDALRSKYKVKEDWLGQDPRKNASPLWKAIEKLKCVILKGACFVVVADLIVHGSNTWNFDLLSNIVDNESMAAIAKVILPANRAPDHLVWTMEESGKFTVKSAASMLIPSDHQASTDPTWAKLWKFKIHERLKIFLWRLGSNTLPTLTNLASRFGMGSLLCPLCHLEDESYSHLFLNCSKVKPIWFGLKWSLLSERLPLVSGADFLKFVINPPINLACSLDTKLIKAQTTIHLALTLDCIWNLRNQIMPQLRLWLETLLETFCNAGRKAAIPQIPCIAEALAIDWALQLARLEKFLDIQVEGDAQVCINAINGHTADIPWKILQVISNVKVLAASFKSCSFVWVRRSANSVAHSLAKEASASPSCFHCNNSNLPPSVHEAWIRDLRQEVPASKPSESSSNVVTISITSDKTSLSFSEKWVVGPVEGGQQRLVKDARSRGLRCHVGHVHRWGNQKSRGVAVATHADGGASLCWQCRVWGDSEWIFVTRICGVELQVS
uniref:Reverse transcriptase domain-containing protein n=1 Tax=Fagus sylvatica TaxID=28930 RepID=A0A2N9HGL8_FAGSY